MTKEESDKLYKELEEEEKNLRNQLDQIANKNPAVKGDYEVRVPNEGEDRDDVINESTELDSNFAMVKELESKLQDILRAKEKIKNGTY